MGELKRAVATAVPPVKSAVITVPADPAEREVLLMAASFRAVLICLRSMSAACPVLGDARRMAEDSGRIYNLIEILREFDEFSDDLELSVAARCDEETLWELYREVVEERLSDTSYWNNRTPREIERFHEEIEIVDVEVDDLQFSGGDAITFDASLRFNVKGTTDEGEYGYQSSRDTFTYRISGYLETPSSVDITDINFRH